MKRKEDDWYYAEMVKNEMDIMVARNIKRLREEHGISRAEMEEGAGLPYGILAQIENLHKVAGKSIQKRLGKYLKTPLEEFYRPVTEKERVAEAAAEYAPAMQYTPKERAYVQASGHFQDKGRGHNKGNCSGNRHFFKSAGR